MTSLEQRVQNLEVALASHTGACREKEKRMDDVFERSLLDHQHINEHLDTLEVDVKLLVEKQGRTRTEMATIITISTLVVTAIIGIVATLLIKKLGG